MMPMMINAEQAQHVRLTASLQIGGSGGGDWRICVEQGTCKVTEEQATNADLAMSYQDAETFLTTMRGMQNPLVAMLTGKVKIQGFQKMGLFGKLFAEPKPDRIIQPTLA
jgi:putative sterol carrier protein